MKSDPIEQEKPEEERIGFVLDPAIPSGVIVQFLGLCAAGSELAGINVTFENGRLILGTAGLPLERVAALQKRFVEAAAQFRNSQDMEGAWRKVCEGFSASHAAEMMMRRYGRS